MRSNFARLLFALALDLLATAVAFAQCPHSVPVEGAALTVPLPLFPADNWWNQDLSSASVALSGW